MILRSIWLLILLAICPAAYGQEFLSLFDEESRALLKQQFLFINPDTLEVRNKLFAEVTCTGTVFIQEKALSPGEFGERLLSFIGSDGTVDALPTSPQEATVVLDWKTAASECRGISSRVGDVMLAYLTIRDDMARRDYGRPFVALGEAERLVVERAVPLRIIPYPVVAVPDVPETVSPAESLVECPIAGQQGTTTVRVASDGNVQVDGREVAFEVLEAELYTLQQTGIPGDPFCFYLTTSRQTPYARYTKVLDTIWAVMRRVWDEQAHAFFDRAYAELSDSEKACVKETARLTLMINDLE